MKLHMSKCWRVYSLLTGLAILTLFILACGAEEPTPAPTPEPIDIAGITAEVQKTIQQEVGKIQEDISKIQTPLTEAEIRDLIAAAVRTGAPEGVSAQEIQSMIDSAVTATAAEAVTEAEVTEAIGKAIAAAAATAPDPLTMSDIEKIVKAAIPAPAPTPAPPAPRPLQPPHPRLLPCPPP